MKNTLFSLRAYFKKELLEGRRTHRFSILAIAILFFSIADPLMIKLMPYILESQLEGVDLGNLISISRQEALSSYSNTLYQIGTLVVALALMDRIGGERSKKTLTIPISMGSSTDGILLGKLLVYSSYLLILTSLGFSICYSYSAIIFDQDSISFLAAIKAGLSYGLFYTYILSLIFLLSSLTDKSFIAGLGSLIIAYSLPLLKSVKGVERFLPNTLLTEADLFETSLSSQAISSLIVTLLLIVLLNLLAALRLRRISYV